MHQIARFDIKFSKFSGGACPLTPLAWASASSASPLNNHKLCFIDQLLKILVRTCLIVLTVTTVLHHNFGMYFFLMPQHCQFLAKNARKKYLKMNWGCLKTYLKIQKRVLESP